jgi:hypothetical protein
MRIIDSEADAVHFAGTDEVACGAWSAAADAHRADGAA